MTIAKYTPEERKERQREIGRKLGKWRQEHKRTPEEIDNLSKKSKEWHDSLSCEEKKRRSEAHSRSAKKQMSDPAARKNVSEHMKRIMKQAGNTRRVKFTDDVRMKISESQKGKPKEWLKDPDRLLRHRREHADHWFLISPNNQSFHCVGLVMFIESNKHLFTKYQLELTGEQKRPRIAWSLTGLSPRRKRPQLTACGWQWDLDAELKFFREQNNYTRA